MNEKDRIILASASPRRAAILKNFGIDFIKLPVTIDESPLDKESPKKYVKRIAEMKAEKAGERKKGIIISADTIVWKNGFLGKPKDQKDAKRMLRILSGSEHFVYSAISILDNREKNTILITSIAKTKVIFYELSDKEISKYIDTKEPMDKAGAYGIQGIGGIFIKRIEGSYFNVVGFPVDLFYKTMKKLKLDHFVL